LIVTIKVLHVTETDALETATGALSAPAPVGIFSNRTLVVPLFCNQEGTFLMTTFTDPVTPPRFPTTIMDLAALAS
jgi:hypothetical protein